MIDFFIGVVVGVALFYIGIKIAIRILVNYLYKQIEELQKEVDNAKIDARLEEHNGVFYVYKIEDNSFLGQGQTLGELKEHFKNRTNEYRINIAEGDDHAIAKLKATAD
jgi:hypothetical protein